VQGARLAARLYGAADTLRVALDIPLPPADYALNERSIIAARNTLGETAFAAAWAEGEALELEQAIEEAAAADSTPTQPNADTSAPLISRREREVIALLAEGCTNRQIAAELGLAPRTVDTHVGNILRKLGLSTRQEVAAWAAQHDADDTSA